MSTESPEGSQQPGNEMDCTEEKKEPMEAVEKKRTDRAMMMRQIEGRFYQYNEDRLIKPFLPVGHDQEHADKLRFILEAIVDNYTEIITFHLTHFNTNLPGSTSAKVRISMLLFGEDFVEEQLIFRGELKTVQEINKHVVDKFIRNNGDFSSAYLVVIVTSEIVNARRRDFIDNTIEIKTFYGAKSLKQGNSEEEFVFNCGNTGIYVATSDDPCFKSLSFDITKTKKWMSSHSRTNELCYRTKHLSKTNAPFVAYEMKDLYGDEDWDAIKRRYHLFRSFSVVKEGENSTSFTPVDEQGIAGKKPIITWKFGRCPLTFTEYSDMKDYVEFLNEQFDDLKFTDISTNGINIVGMQLNQEALDREVEARKYKPEKWEDGKVPKNYFSYIIDQQPLPYRTGKRGTGSWVVHKTGRDWKAEETERRIINLKTLPEESKPFSILLNQFIMQDEHAVYAGNQTRRKMLLKFFEEKTQDLVDLGMESVQYACSYLAELLQKNVLTPEDYSIHFDRIGEALLKKIEGSRMKMEVEE